MSSSDATAPWLRLYFRSERAGVNSDLTGRLIEFISGTQRSLDCAIYDLRHPHVLAALQEAARTGKRLRIAYDASKERTGGLTGDPKPSGTEAALNAAGLLPFATPVHNSGHLMHNKFLIRDGVTLWTGSANFTVGGLEKQDNNCLTLRDQGIIAQYGAVFTDLLSGEHSHARRRSSLEAAHLPTTPTSARPSVTTAYFAPFEGEQIEQTISQALAHARKVRVMAFLISDPGILQALSHFASSSADIRGVIDPHGMQDVLRYKHADDPSFWFMRDRRFVFAPTHAFNPNTEQDFMHNKVLIIDDHLVVTGSFNFSENAELNDENLLILNSAQVASAYTSYFDRLYAAYSEYVGTRSGAGAWAGA
ncbi:MAG TPA: phospholipase D-like domain-containing protein [Ktedonobacterales bacterium]